MGKFFSDLKTSFGSDALKRIGRKVFKDDCFGLAGQMAYFLLFSLFPFLMFLVALMSLVVVDPGSNLDTLTESIEDFLPGDVVGLLTDYTERTLRAASSGVLFLGALTALWSGSGASYALIKASNLAYGLRETRPSWKVWGISFLMVLCFVLLVGVLAVVIFSPEEGDYLQRLTGLPGSLLILWDALSWVALFVTLTLIHAVLYYLAPDADLPFKWITPGGLMATVLILVASVTLNFYVTNLAHYDQLYGSLTAVLVLMLWLYVMGFMVIVGVEINAVLARITEEREDVEIVRYEDPADQ
jgi:membrane protein